mgnify:CR=1 FL=1
MTSRTERWQDGTVINESWPRAHPSCHTIDQIPCTEAGEPYQSEIGLSAYGDEKKFERHYTVVGFHGTTFENCRNILVTGAHGAPGHGIQGLWFRVAGHTKAVDDPQWRREYQNRVPDAVLESLSRCAKPQHK